MEGRNLSTKEKTIPRRQTQTARERQKDRKETVTESQAGNIKKRKEKKKYICAFGLSLGRFVQTIY